MTSHSARPTCTDKHLPRLKRARRICDEPGSNTIMARVVCLHGAECPGHQLSVRLQLTTRCVSIRCIWLMPQFTGGRPWTSGIMKLQLGVHRTLRHRIGMEHVMNLRGTRPGVTPPGQGATMICKHIAKFSRSATSYAKGCVRLHACCVERDSEHSSSSIGNQSHMLCSDGVCRGSVI